MKEYTDLKEENKQNQTEEAAALIKKNKAAGNNDLCIRKAVKQDLDGLVALYEKAKQYMRAHGNLHQWNDGHPGTDDLSQDIQNGCLYVVESGRGSDAQIEAAFVFYVGQDPTYQYIDHGSWPNDLPYAAVHKVASKGTRKAMGHVILEWCRSQWPVLRMDTHQDNYPMQHLLIKEGFRHAGTIYLASGDPRLAYQYQNDWDHYNQS